MIESSVFRNNDETSVARLQGIRNLVGDKAVQFSGADRGCLRMEFYWLINGNH